MESRSRLLSVIESVDSAAEEVFRLCFYSIVVTCVMAVIGLFLTCLVLAEQRRWVSIPYAIAAVAALALLVGIIVNKGRGSRNGNGGRKPAALLGRRRSRCRMTIPAN